MMYLVAGVAGVAYTEALDEALCFGWIDSLVKRLDDDRFVRGLVRQWRDDGIDVRVVHLSRLEGLPLTLGAQVAARWAGLEVAGISLVTNPGAGYTGEPLTHEEVLAAGAEAGPRFVRLVRRWIRELETA